MTRCEESSEPIYEVSKKVSKLVPSGRVNENTHGKYLGVI